ncbi:hypothetical protein GQ55_5G299900 [Panicum hallii var. hallii]|uniref:Uncharacterized protein n=1 Tax=Panicum hallii var. hallii TaxID=1504633 RepID=A0A2T7DLG9_9POAL|nr:hypothetical protein GQ55_5G299900 [Panicum hallii var. hallii]
MRPLAHLDLSPAWQFWFRNLLGHRQPVSPLPHRSSGSARCLFRGESAPPSHTSGLCRYSALRCPPIFAQEEYLIHDENWIAIQKC